jgi:hypothetical protein
MFCYNSRQTSPILQPYKDELFKAECKFILYITIEICFQVKNFQFRTGLDR